MHQRSKPVIIRVRLLTKAVNAGLDDRDQKLNDDPMPKGPIRHIIIIY